MNSFVGREAELARVRALLPREPLFLFYGVAGIGKSEIVYKIVEEARSLPALRRAATVALSVRPGQRCEHLLPVLRLRLGAASIEPAASLADDLDAIAKALEARPTLVFLDDVHNLDTEAAGEMLGHLARYVSRSRIFVASRMELLFPADTPPPVVSRLAPLSREATFALVAEVGHALGVTTRDPAEIFTRAGGSPFYVLRELADLRFAPRRGDDSLAAALRTLAPHLRHTLLLARLLRGRLSPADLGDTEALWELSRRFLIDIDRGVIIVHDLIGEALAREASPDELKAARRDAALLLLSRADAAPPERAADLAVDVMEAVRQLTVAGEARAAWEALERWRRPLAHLGLDLPALELLPTLRAALPEQQGDVALRMAQILIRHFRIREARALLDELAAQDPALAREARWLRLSAEIAQRTGDMDTAAAQLEEALSASREPRERLHAAVDLAVVRARRGEGEAARRSLAATLQGAPGLSQEDEGRAGWARALSLLTDGRAHEAAAAAAQAAARLPAGEPAEGARVRLAIVELIARCTCDEIDAAAALLRQIQRHPSATTAQRAPTVALCQGLLLFARGDLTEARPVLEQAHQYLSAQRDPFGAMVASHQLGLTLLGLGDEQGARAIAGAAEHGAGSGLAGVGSHFALLAARARLQALRCDDAEAALAPLGAAPSGALPPWMKARVEACRALLHGLRGEVGQARAALDRAADLLADDGSAARQRELDLAAAEVLLLCGDAPGAGARAEAAHRHYKAKGRRQTQAQAALLRAAALLSCAPDGDGALPPDEDAASLAGGAEALFAEAEELAERHGYALAWAPLLGAALRLRRGEERLAQSELAAALRALGLPAPGSGAWKGPPGLRALLGALGLAPFALTEPEARLPKEGPDRARAADEPGGTDRREAAEQPAIEYDLVVDLRRNVIRAPEQAQSVAGRPLLCALLSQLTPSPRVHSAEQLFYQVWGGREYHPLRHRNTIHVAIMRLRRVLAGLLPGREVVETTPQGWRLSEGISLHVIRASAVLPGPVPAAGQLT